MPLHICLICIIISIGLAGFYANAKLWLFPLSVRTGAGLLENIVNRILQIEDEAEKRLVEAENERREILADAEKKSAELRLSREREAAEKSTEYDEKQRAFYNERLRVLTDEYDGRYKALEADFAAKKDRIAEELFYSVTK